MPVRQRLRTLADAEPRLFVVVVATGVSLVTFPLVAAVAQVGGGPFRFGGVDFKAYYLAGLRLRAGLPLYESGHFVEQVAKPRATEYLYPPVAALPFAALTLLPPLPARAVWVGGQLLVLWGGVLSLCRGFGYRLATDESLLVGLALVGFQPVFFLARIGNVSAAMAGLLCLSAAVTVVPRPLVGDRPFLGGALATLGVLPKPFAAPGGAHLLDDWRRLVGATVALATLVGLGLLVFDVETHRAYLDVLVAGKGWGEGDPTQVPFHARPYYRFPAVAPVVRGLVLGVTVAVALLATRVDEGARAFAVGSVAIPLVAPTANTLTLVLAVPGLVVASLLELRSEGRPDLVLGSVFVLHWSVYAVRTVGEYGPDTLPGLPWAAVESVLLVHPATVALAVVYGLCVWRVLARTRDV